MYVQAIYVVTAIMHKGSTHSKLCSQSNAQLVITDQGKYRIGNMMSQKRPCKKFIQLSPYAGSSELLSLNPLTTTSLPTLQSGAPNRHDITTIIIVKYMTTQCNVFTFPYTILSPIDAVIWSYNGTFKSYTYLTICQSFKYSMFPGASLSCSSK